MSSVQIKICSVKNCNKKASHRIELVLGRKQGGRLKTVLPLLTCRDHVRCWELEEVVDEGAWLEITRNLLSEGKPVPEKAFSYLEYNKLKK